MSRSAAGTAFVDRNMRGGSGDMALPRGIQPCFSLERAKVLIEGSGADPLTHTPQISPQILP